MYTNPISRFIVFDKSILHAKITLSQKKIVSKLSFKYSTCLYIFVALTMSHIAVTVYIK